MRVANILDPVQSQLDQRVFNKTKPRQSIINFIMRLYYRALDKELGIPPSEIQEWADLVLTGSLTTYQFSNSSDADVTVFPNYEEIWNRLGLDPEQARKELVSLSVEHLDGTFLPGTTHPLQFFVAMPNVYAQDLYKPGLRSGYNILDRKWIVPPERERAHNVELEMPDYWQKAVAMADKMNDLLDHDPERAREMWHMLHKKRQLEQTQGQGDFSEGNIVYKYMLNHGIFDRLKNELHEYIAKTAADLPQIGSVWTIANPWSIERPRYTVEIIDADDDEIWTRNLDNQEEDSMTTALWNNWVRDGRAWRTNQDLNVPEDQVIDEIWPDFLPFSEEEQEYYRESAFKINEPKGDWYATLPPLVVERAIQAARCPRCGGHLLNGGQEGWYCPSCTWTPELEQRTSSIYKPLAEPWIEIGAFIYSATKDELVIGSTHYGCVMSLMGERYTYRGRDWEDAFKALQPVFGWMYENDHDTQEWKVQFLSDLYYEYQTRDSIKAAMHAIQLEYPNKNLSIATKADEEEYDEDGLYFDKLGQLQPNEQQELTNHIEEIAKELDVQITFQPNMEGGLTQYWYGADGSVMLSIVVPIIKDETDYLVTLHELAHCYQFRYYPSADQIKGLFQNQELELWAWHTALEWSKIPIPLKSLEQAKAWFDTYKDSPVKYPYEDLNWIQGKIAVDWSGDDLDPRVLENTEGMESWEKLEQQQIIPMAEQLDTKINWLQRFQVQQSKLDVDYMVKPKGILGLGELDWSNPTLSITANFPHITGEISYYAALHELGHADYYRHYPTTIYNGISQEKELYALHYAIEHSQIAFSDEILNWAQESFSTYENESVQPLHWVTSATDHLWDERVTQKVLYDFDKDRIILGTQADLNNDPPNPDLPNYKLIGEYNNKAVTLYEADKQWINPSYFHRLWTHSFPERKLEDIYFKRGDERVKLDTLRRRKKSGWELSGLRFYPGDAVFIEDGFGHQFGGEITSEGVEKDGEYWYLVKTYDKEGYVDEALWPESDLQRPKRYDQPGESTLEDWLGIPPEGEQYYREANRG